MAQPDELIQKLREGDYYSRSSAARALGQMGGEKAEDALMEALEDEDEWVQEYAAEALGKLHCRRAVKRMGGLLRSNNYKVRSSAAEALGRIGGDDAKRLLETLVADSDSWVREAAVTALKRISGETTLSDSEKFSPAAQAARGVESDLELSMSDAPVEQQSGRTSFSRTSARTPLTPEQIIEEITHDTSIRYKAMRNGYLLRVPVGSSRHQKIRLKFDSTDEDGSPIVQIFTLIAPAKPEHYQWVLKLNPAFSYGAIGIVKIDDREFFALTNTLLEENVDTKAIEKSVRILAEKGDALEQKLIKKDIW